MATIQVLIKIDGDVVDGVEMDVDDEEAAVYADSIRNSIMEEYEEYGAEVVELDDDDDDDYTGESEGPERF
jgi:hypothetical protein